MPHFDWDIHGGEILVSVVGAGIVWMVRKVLKTANRFLTRAEQGFRDIDEHAEVIDQHTGVLLRAGLAKGVGLKRLDRRHAEREYDSSL